MISVLEDQQQHPSRSGHDAQIQWTIGTFRSAVIRARKRSFKRWHAKQMRLREPVGAGIVQSKHHAQLQQQRQQQEQLQQTLLRRVEADEKEESKQTAEARRTKRQDTVFSAKRLDPAHKGLPKGPRSSRRRPSPFRLKRLNNLVLEFDLAAGTSLPVSDPLSADHMTSVIAPGQLFPPGSSLPQMSANGYIQQFQQSNDAALHLQPWPPTASCGNAYPFQAEMSSLKTTSPASHAAMIQTNQQIATAPGRPLAMGHGPWPTPIDSHASMTLPSAVSNSLPQDRPAHGQGLHSQVLPLPGRHQPVSSLPGSAQLSWGQAGGFREALMALIQHRQRMVEAVGSMGSVVSPQASSRFPRPEPPAWPNLPATIGEGPPVGFGTPRGSQDLGLAPPPGGMSTGHPALNPLSWGGLMGHQSLQSSFSAASFQLSQLPSVFWLPGPQGGIPFQDLASSLPVAVDEDVVMTGEVDGIGARLQKSLVGANPAAMGAILERWISNLDPKSRAEVMTAWR